MWSSSYEMTVKDIEKKQIWKVWSDVNHWHQWDHDIEFARISGPFCEGAHFELKPKEGPKVKIKIVQCNSLNGFTDLACFPGAKMYSIHLMEEVAEGLRLTHTVRVEGVLSWLWRRLVVQKVADGMSEQMNRLVMVSKQRQ